METSSTVKFQPNIPVDVALKYESGKPVTSSFNGAEQIMYTLSDERKMYLDPDVAKRIDALRLKRGEAFTICKVGKGKDAQWAIGRKGESPRPELVRPAFTTGAIDTPDQALSRTLAGQSFQMTNALKAAVKAADEAQRYAKEIGFTVVFTPTDIMQMAMIAARLQAGAR